MHTAIVCVASNINSGNLKLDEFVVRLKAQIDSSAVCSGIYATRSITDGVTPYYNLVASYRTPLSLPELTQMMKQWEKDAGRIHGQKEVALDIDVVVFDGIVVRPNDFDQSYFKTGYNALDQGLLCKEM